MLRGHHCCAPSATSHRTRENIYRCSRYIASGNKSTVFIFNWRVFNFCLVSKEKGNMQRNPDSSGLESGGASSWLVNNTTRAGSSLLAARVRSSPLDSLGGSSRVEPSRVQVPLGSSPRVQGCLEPSPLESRSGLGSSLLVNNTTPSPTTNFPSQCSQHSHHPDHPHRSHRSYRSHR